MSCRETSSGSMITSWANFSHDGRTLTGEPAILSTFHQLRRAYLETDESQRRTYTADDYHSLLDRQERRINEAHSLGRLTDRQRDSLLRRLAAARTEEVPDQGHLYAMHNLVPAVRNRANGMRAVARSIADRTGQSQEQVLEQIRNDARGRTSRNTSLPEGAMQRAVELGLPRDAGTVYAWSMAEAQARQAEIAAMRRAPQRITMTQVPEGSRSTGIDGVEVAAYGYDPRNGRLEVEVVDTRTGESTLHAYRNVPEYTSINVITTPGGTWAREVRGNPDYQYEDEYAQVSDGVAPRCPTCGQYADASHSCPAPRNRTAFSSYDRGSRWTAQSINTYGVSVDGDLTSRTETVRLPAVRRLQQAANSTGALIHCDRYESITLMNEDGRHERGVIRGSFTADRDENGDLQVDTSSAQCSCPEYQRNGHCRHVDFYAQAIRDRIERPSAAEVAARDAEASQRAVADAATRVQRRMEEARASDWTQDQAAMAEAAATWRRESEVLYSEDPDAFAADLQNALDARAAKNGEPDIPFMRENALDGMATRGSGQGFGMEIEFKFDPNMSYADRAEALNRISTELYEAGITRTNRQERYGYSRQFGFVDDHTLPNGTGTWCFEQDGSVDGELVTPVMYDEPETWEKLDKAVEILRRNGARPGTEAGAHVHVGTGMYGGSPAAYAELARLVNQHEDAVVRLASDPSRGTHRSNGYAEPLPAVPPAGFSDVSDVRSWQRQRYSAVNFAHVSGSQGDHPEFRIFDSTLDSGSMQAQVKMAVAMTHAAQRNAAAGGTARNREGWGDHVRRNPGPGVAQERTVTSLMEGSGTVRSLLDTLFRRREDKAQLAAVYANTNWSTNNRRH